MTTHLTHPEDLEGEEPELVLIDDEEFEASHPYDEDEDDFEPDDSDFEIAFADDLDEAVTARTSSEGHGPDADKRMAGLFSAQHEVPEGTPVDAASDQNVVAPQRGRAVSTAAVAGVAVAGAVSTPAPRSRRETSAEKKRQRELLKRRKQMDKAAQQDDKESRRAQKEDAAAAAKEAAAAEKRAAAEAKRQAAEDKKRAAAEAKQRLEDDKVRAAEDKQRVADEKKRLAEDTKRAAAEAKQRQAEDKKRAAAEAKQQAAEAKRQAAPKRRKSGDNASEFSVAAIMGQARAEQAESVRTNRDVAESDLDADDLDWLKGETVASGQVAAKRSQRKKGANRGLLVAVAVVIVVAAGGLIYATTRPHTATPRTAAAPTAPATTVASALAAMTKSSTADVTYSMSLSGGQTVTVDGGGNIDLASSAANLSLTYTGNGHTFPEQLVYDGSSAYYDLGLINHYIAPGSYWVQMDLATDHSADPGLGAGGALADPSSLVALADASSATATEVGATQLNGAPATEYSISLDAAQIARLANLPSFVSGQLAMEPFTGVNFEVFVNGSGQVSLVQAVGTLSGSGQPVVVHTTLDVSHFGTLVSVVAPPPAEVVSEQQYESNAQRLANAPGA